MSSPAAVPRPFVADAIDDRPLSALQRWTILLCGIVVVLDGFDTQCMGFLVPVIAEDLSMPLPAFGPVLSAALFGLMVAAMASGPIADRYGRRWVVIVSVIVFALFALLTARATTVNELLLYRFLTGLGLGGAMPNAVALTSEYTPRRLQPIVVGAIFVGMPAGALIASQAASVMIPLWGWRSVFVLGGALPLVVAVALIKFLPESVEWRTQQARTAGVPVRQLFTDGRALGTLLLWIPFFMNLLILYFILSWLPALLRQSAMPLAAGVQAVAMFSVGGIIGILTAGRLMIAVGARALLIVQFVLCAVLIATLANVATSLLAMLITTMALGICGQGAQAGLNALAAMFYPTSARATGIGWALGVGRIGSIVGPSLGGILLSMHWTPKEILIAGIAPAACAAMAIAAASLLPRRATAFQ
jgi:AAHS family 4-hydroxybenzoate transporter-like MFS transporter